MLRKSILGLAVACVIACGGSDEGTTNDQAAAAQPSERIAACALLTTDEVVTATGWRSVTAIDSTSVGGACNYRGPNEFNDVVSVMVSRGLPAMANSAELAQFRSSKIGPNDAIKPEITALDGFGVPAVRNQLPGAALATIEVAKNDVLLTVTANSFEAAKKLAPAAIGRLP